MLYNDQMIIWKWKFRRREWRKEVSDVKCDRIEVLLDPLTPRSKYRESRSNNERTLGNDSSVDFVDPLGATKDDSFETTIKLSESWISKSRQKQEPILVNTLEKKSDNLIVMDEEIPDFIPWSVKRNEILREFPAKEKSSPPSKTFFNIPSITVGGRAAHRLEQLEDSSGSKRLAELSREEYVENINELKKKLLIAWENEKKIESVKIIIELSRILSSTAAPNFYPNQFVLVTDILDLFGNLVFERLRTKASKERIELGQSPLPKCFTVADVPETTKETAKNWFCKVGDIMELLPRFYVETSIIGCILFLDADSLAINLIRLSGIPLSISHPLIASYARAYLCRVAMRLLPLNRAPHWKCLNDWMQSFVVQPATLLIPAMEWILQCVTYKAVSYDDLRRIWEYCKMSEKRQIIVRSFLNAVSPIYLNEHCLEACKIVTSGDEISAQELCIFGKRLLMSETPEDARKVILKNVWRRVLKLALISEFVDCTIVWIEFTARYFSINELGIMLDILIKKISTEKKHEAFSDSLIIIVEKIVLHQKNVANLFTLEQFSSLISLFRSDGGRAKCSTIILTAFVNHHPIKFSDNFQLGYQILGLCKFLHNSLNATSSEEERQTVSFIIQCALDRFDLNSDPERALNFLVDCRATLSNIDELISYLVNRVCALGFLVVQNQERVRNAAELLRACIANAFITTASLSTPMCINLYVHIGLLALSANSLPQVDAIVKTAIELLASCQDINPMTYRSMASNFLGFLVVVPDSPEKPPLYMFNGFLNAVVRFPWHNYPLEHARLLIDCIYYLSAIGQVELPYHIREVQSNDSIYGNNEKYNEAIVEKVEIIMGRYEELYNENILKYPLISIELLETILVIGNVEKLSSLILELFSKPVEKMELVRRNAIFERIKLLSKRKPAVAQLVKDIYGMETKKF